MERPEEQLSETRIHGHRVTYRSAGDPSLPVLTQSPR